MVCSFNWRFLYIPFQEQMKWIMNKYTSRIEQTSELILIINDRNLFE